MPNQVLTRRARKALQIAREQAQRAGRRWFGPSHILLGMLKEGTGIGARSLSVLGVTYQTVPDSWKIRRSTDSIRLETSESQPDPPASIVLANACRIARERGRAWVGTEHLLLSLLETPISCALLGEIGIDRCRLRSLVLEIIED